MCPFEFYEFKYNYRSIRFGYDGSPFVLMPIDILCKRLYENVVNAVYIILYIVYLFPNYLFGRWWTTYGFFVVFSSAWVALGRRRWPIRCLRQSENRRGWSYPRWTCTFRQIPFLRPSLKLQISDLILDTYNTVGILCSAGNLIYFFIMTLRKIVVPITTSWVDCRVEYNLSDTYLF